MTSANNRRQLNKDLWRNSFCQARSKILVGNYEPIMGICWNIFIIINLHNLQMLFMLWIKNTFSECLAPLHKHEDPQWKTLLRRSWPGPQTRGAFGGSYPQIFFVSPQILFQTYDKNKNLSPLKYILSPQSLKPGYEPGSAKIVSTIRIFCFEGHSASRCSIT